MPTKKREGEARPVNEVQQGDFVRGLHLSATGQYVRVDSIITEKRDGTVVLKDKDGRGRMYAATDLVLTRNAL